MFSSFFGTSSLSINKPSVSSSKPWNRPTRESLQHASRDFSWVRPRPFNQFFELNGLLVIHSQSRTIFQCVFPYLVHREIKKDYWNILLNSRYILLHFDFIHLLFFFFFILSDMHGTLGLIENQKCILQKKPLLLLGDIGLALPVTGMPKNSLCNKQWQPFTSIGFKLFKQFTRP